VSWLSWGHSLCASRLQPLSWELRWREHARLAITTLVEVTFLLLGPIPSKALAYTDLWLRTVLSHVEWGMVITLQCSSKWLLCRTVTLPLCQMLLIGNLLRSTVFTNDTLQIIRLRSWIVITAMLNANLATWWSTVPGVQWRTLCPHDLWRHMVANYYRCTMSSRKIQSMVDNIAGNSDLRQNTGQQIFHSVVRNCGV